MCRVNPPFASFVFLGLLLAPFVARGETATVFNGYLRRLQACDPDSDALFHRLYEEALPVLSDLLRKRLQGSGAQAHHEDAAQECFLRYWRTPCEKRPVTFGWFVMNGLQHAWQARSRELSSDSVEWLATSAPVATQEEGESQQLDETLFARWSALVTRLEPDERKAMLLLRRGFYQHEIGDVLGCTQSWAYKIKERALRKMRTWLETDPLLDLTPWEREAALASLPEPERTVAVPYREGMSVRDLAAELGQPERDIERTLQSAERRLQSYRGKSGQLDQLVETHTFRTMVAAIQNNGTQARAVETLSGLDERTRRYLVLFYRGVSVDQMAAGDALHPRTVGSDLGEALGAIRKIRGVSSDFRFGRCPRRYDREPEMPIFLFNDLSPREWLTLPTILASMDERWVTTLELLHAGQELSVLREGSRVRQPSKVILLALRRVASQLGRSESDLTLALRPRLRLRARELARRFVGSVPQDRTDRLIQALTQLPEKQLRVLELRASHDDWDEAARVERVDTKLFRQRVYAVIEGLALSLEMVPGTLVFRVPDRWHVERRRLFDLTDEEDHGKARTRMLALPARQIEVILLRREGLTNLEVSVATGLSPDEVDIAFREGMAAVAIAIGKSPSQLQLAPAPRIERVRQLAKTEAVRGTSEDAGDREEWIATHGPKLFVGLNRRLAQKVPEVLRSLRPLEVRILRLRSEGHETAPIARLIGYRYKSTWNLLRDTMAKVATALDVPEADLALATPALPILQGAESVADAELNAAIERLPSLQRSVVHHLMNGGSQSRMPGVSRTPLRKACQAALATLASDLGLPDGALRFRRAPAPIPRP